jgi:predicted metal-dependent peptidase
MNEVSQSKGLIIQKLCLQLSSKMIRDPIFRPHGLKLLEYEIIPTTSLPKGAGAAVDHYRKSIYIGMKQDDPISTIKEQKYITAFILLHEIMHIILFHAYRIKNRNPYMWNIAGDFVINLLLQALESHQKVRLLQCNNNDYNSRFCIDDMFDNQIEEEVYDVLMSKQCKYKQTISTTSIEELQKGCDSGGENKDDGKEGKPEPKPGDAGSNEDNTQDIKVIETTFEVNGKKFKDVQVEFPTPPNMTEEELAAHDKKMKESAALGRQMMESELIKGTGSTKIGRFLKRLFKVKVDWKKILSDSIATALEKSFEVAWSKPNPIWLANPITIAYRPSRIVEEKYGTVIFSIDESGSMSDNDIRDAIGVVQQSREFYKNLLILKHDWDVGWNKLYESMEDVDIDELLKRRQCGGTSHKDVFKYINDYIAHDDDVLVSCYISCSDLDSDVEEHQEVLPSWLPRIYITNNDNSHPEISGKVIKLKV